MKEVPNLNYINQLAKHDAVLKNRLIMVLINEFPTEVQNYETQALQSDLLKMSECVHKLKHKIGILGLENAYHMAATFEEQLKNGTAELQVNFENVLKNIGSFLKELQTE
jgi:HPt (histidine-containing phosphotransfer) domain-containing protein